MMMNSGAIIGAGIAGLGAGIFAQRHGFQLPIYERHRALNCGHHLLWVAPNGLQVLSALGLFEQVQALAVPQRAMQFATKQLRTLMTLSGPKLASSCQFPIMAIKRRDLWQLLTDAFHAGGGTIHYGHELSGLQVCEDSVTLSFHGRPDDVAHSYIVGADGMGSVVRSMSFPRSFVAYQGICTWLGESVSPVAAAHVGTTTELWGYGTRFVMTSLDGHTVYWSALERPACYESNAAAIPATIPDELAQRFADYHPDVRAVLAAANRTRIQRCNFGVVSGLKSYAHGRIALIGDAAHGMPPNMGQGASLGLEDAWWVIHELARSDDPRLAFGQYDRDRRPRARSLMSMANSMNVLFQPQSKLLSSVRDVVAAWVPDGLTQLRMSRLYQAPQPQATR